MAVDYDVVVIGNTTTGIYAALSAARLKARVAIVAQNRRSDSTIVRHALAEIGTVAQSLDRANQLGVYNPDIVFGLPQLLEAKKWADAINTTLQQLESPAVLASLGIEVIASAGEFCLEPQFGFLVDQRVLRSRAFLIATEQVPIIPKIEGLQTAGYLTSDRLGEKIPSKLVIIGDDATGIEVAQTFNNLGSQVILIMSSGFLEPIETLDREAAFLIQAQLESEGIRVLTHTQVTQVKKIQSKKWVQAGNQAIETDEVFLAAGFQPNLESLNLEAMGISFPVRVNTKLRSTHDRIYICGNSVSSMAQQEVNIALKNALFFPRFKISDRQIPRAIFSTPQLAWVGLTESQATQAYGKDVVIVRQFFKTLAKAQIQTKTTGFIKVITRRNGRILGAQIVGTDASELISPIALAIHQKLNIQVFQEIGFLSPTGSEIFTRVAIEWESQKLNHNSGLQDFLESFFRWRRANVK